MKNCRFNKKRERERKKTNNEMALERDRANFERL